MSDADEPDPRPDPPASGSGGERAAASVPESPRDDSPPTAATMTMVVYVLYLVGLASGIAALFGVILAYAYRPAAAGSWSESHIRYQIRTWWLGLLVLATGIVLSALLIGIPILIFFFVWTAVRTIKGLSAHGRREPIANPDTLFW